MDTLGVDVNDSGNSAAQIHVSYLFIYLFVVQKINSNILFTKELL